MALTSTPPPELGASCPDFKLPAANGRAVSRSDLQTGNPFLVMFICNHCPYVKAIEDRLIALGKDFARVGMRMVGISANDPASYAEDSFENMQKRSTEKSYSFAYLFDETQEVAKKFGAVCTPDFFLYDGDGKLAYRGRLDDSWKDPGLVTSRDLWRAACELLDGNPLGGPETQIPSMGCSIKWRKGNLQ